MNDNSINLLKQKSFCPNDEKVVFESCGGIFCHRGCSVKKNWNDLTNEYQEDLIHKIKTQYLILTP